MLEVVPITFAEANEYVRRFHRHHKSVIGCKYCVACSDGVDIVGVAIVGRPVARSLDNGRTLEVNRLCTTGVKNACSILYAAAWRAAKALGYLKLITYILASESGSSLRASGWREVGSVKGRSWSCESRPRIDKIAAQSENKLRFEVCAEQNTKEAGFTGHQHGQLAMPGICPDCNRYLLSCTRPGVLQCDDFKSALQA